MNGDQAAEAIARHIRKVRAAASPPPVAPLASVLEDIGKQVSQQAIRSRRRVNVRVTRTPAGARLEFAGEASRDAAKAARKLLNERMPELSKAVTAEMVRRIA